MAAPTKDAGVLVDCPQCGATVLQKAMIPILADGGAGVHYLCVTCARQLIDTAPKDAAVPEGESGDEDESDESDTEESGVDESGVGEASA